MTRPRLVHVFSTFAAGGPQVRTASILDRLGDEFDHIIVPMDGVQEAAERLTPKTRAEIVDPPAGINTKNAVPTMRRFLRGLAPDLLLTYNWGAIESIVAAKFGRIRARIHAEDGFGPDEADRQQPRRVWARRVLLRWVSRVVVPSRNLYSIAREQWWCPEKRLVHLDNGIDLDQFEPGRASNLRDALGIPAERIIVGTAAKLRAEKALDRLIEAVAIARAQVDFHLVILGDGPERDRLEQTARTQGIADHVSFPGQVHQPAEFFAGFDLFGMTSITEQMPISVVEAMASGLPIVSTAVGDVPHMVSEDNRPWVLESSKPEGIAGGLLELASDASLRERIGAANRKRALERYDREAMVSSYRALYLAVLEESR